MKFKRRRKLMNRLQQNVTTSGSHSIRGINYVGIASSILCVLFLFSNIYGQGSIFRRQKAESKEIPINTVGAPIVPKPVETTNGSTITVSGNKLPVNICTVAFKREEIKPEPNPFASFLSILVKIAGSVSAASGENVPIMCEMEKEISYPDNDAKQIYFQLKSLRTNLVQNNQKIVLEVGTQFSDTGKTLDNFVKCKSDECSEENFATGEDTLKEKIKNLLATPVPSTQTTEQQLLTASKLIAERYKKQSTEEEVKFIETVNSLIDCFTAELERIKQTREAILAARVEFTKARDALEALDDFNSQNVKTLPNGRKRPDPFVYKKLLPADNNAKVTGTVSCANFLTKQASGDMIPFTVSYQNIPVATVSAGVLFSSLGKKQIAVQPFKTGVDSNGVPTFRTVFAETDMTNFQTIPFSFMNFYISGTPKRNLNFAVGVGVNPNNGKTQIEYFTGPSIGFKNLYIQAGAHFGRQQELSGGFNIGDTVPNGFPSALPIVRRYVAKFAIGISYKIPLP